MFIFFFKQKTAYEMRISDWSSDVCSSDLVRTYEQELDALLKERGINDVTADNRHPLFESLPQQVRENFLQKVLLTELQQTGTDYIAPDGPRFQQYTRGYSALHIDRTSVV